jgi:hypothetical protein
MMKHFFGNDFLTKESHNKIAGRWLLLAVIFVFVFLSSIHIDRPGIQYDEIYFANVALGGIDNSFISYRIWNFPVLATPYTGLLKAYLYYPIFKFFPVSAYSIRIPVVIIGALTLFFTFCYVQKIFGVLVAFITGLILASDPTFIILNKCDWGPVSFSLFLRALSLFFLIKGMESGRKRYFVLCVFSLCLGMFNHLNFIWFVIALALGIFIVFFRELFGFIKANIARSAILLGSLFLLFSFFFLSELLICPSRFQSIFNFDLPGRFPYFKTMFLSTMDGTCTYPFMTGKGCPTAGLFLIVCTVTVVAAFIINFFRPIKIFDRRIGFFAVILAALFSELYISREALGVQHMILIYPFPHLIFAFFIVRIISGFPKNGFRILAINSAILGIGLIVASNLLVYSRYVDAFIKDDTADIWSAEIYNLTEYAKQHSDKFFVNCDWGFHTQLLAFTMGSAKMYELCWALNDLDVPDKDGYRRRFILQYVNTPNAVFIFHKESIMKKAKENFFDLLRQEGIRPVLIKKFGDRGHVRYELYKIRN